jgi:hypothetical protein
MTPHVMTKNTQKTQLTQNMNLFLALFLMIANEAVLACNPELTTDFLDCNTASHQNLVGCGSFKLTKK